MVGSRRGPEKAVPDRFSSSVTIRLPLECVITLRSPHFLVLFILFLSLSRRIASLQTTYSHTHSLAAFNSKHYEQEVPVCVSLAARAQTTKDFSVWFLKIVIELRREDSDGVRR